MEFAFKKSPYHSPKLTVHGSVEKITENGGKSGGPGDEFDGSLGLR